MSYSIIIPCYNEEENVSRVIDLILSSLISDDNFEIIAINDGSTDFTYDVLVEKAKNEPKLRVLNHKSNRGYGASLKTGIKNATKKYVIMYDADGQHRTDDLLKIVNDIKKHQPDAIITQRKGNFYGPIRRRPGKIVLSLMAKILLGKHIKDVNCGLRCFRKEIIIKYLHILPDGFSFSTTSTFLFIQRNYYIIFIDILAYQRVAGKSYVKIWKDGINTIYLILRLITLFNPLKIFLPFAITLFIIGSVLGVKTFIAGKGISVGELLLILTSVITFLMGIMADQISQMRLAEFQRYYPQNS